MTTLYYLQIPPAFLKKPVRMGELESLIERQIESYLFDKGVFQRVSVTITNADRMEVRFEYPVDSKLLAQSLLGNANELEWESPLFANA